MKHHETHHKHPAHKHVHHVHHAKPADQNAEVYVGIPDPVAVRRPLLEGARIAIMTGPIQDKLIEIQDQKLTIRTNLSQVVKDMKNEITRLKMVLPHREIAVQHVKEEHHAAAAAKPVQHRVDKIAEALAAIEERMRSL